MREPRGWPYDSSLNLDRNDQISATTFDYVDAEYQRMMDNPPEVWKEIAGYVGRYEISSKGRVKSLLNNAQRPRKFPKILSQATYDSSYKYVCLSQENKPEVRYIHHLVMLHFGPPRPSPEHEVSHLDGNIHNNDIRNLGWETHDENMKRASDQRMFPLGEEHFSSKLTEDDVREIRKMKEKIGLSCRQIAKFYGTSQTAIHSIIGGKTWKHVK